MAYSRKAYIFITLRGTLLAAAGALYVQGLAQCDNIKLLRPWEKHMREKGLMEYLMCAT
jgi:hypothetical protein